MFIYFWERERERERAGKGQREGDTESEAGSGLWADSIEPNAGLELTSCEIMTWAEVGRLTDWATQVPHFVFDTYHHVIWDNLRKLIGHIASSINNHLFMQLLFLLNKVML